jgi:superoxide dismutase, Fe-Mn family
MPEETYVLPDLPYYLGSLEPHISGRIIELHHYKHHAAYVKAANAALEKLHDLRGKNDLVALSMLEKNLAFNVSGHVLHSVLWTNMSPYGGGEPSGPLAETIESNFAGIEAFRAIMTEAANTVQGSGWALASWEPVAGRLVVQQVCDHRATTAKAPYRCWSSTPGSTPTTCSTRTGSPSSSRPCGTWSTGPTSSAGSKRRGGPSRNSTGRTGLSAEKTT